MNDALRIMLLDEKSTNDNLNSKTTLNQEKSSSVMSSRNNLIVETLTGKQNTRQTNKQSVINTREEENDLVLRKQLREIINRKKSSNQKTIQSGSGQVYQQLHTIAGPETKQQKQQSHNISTVSLKGFNSNIVESKLSSRISKYSQAIPNKKEEYKNEERYETSGYQSKQQKSRIHSGKRNFNQSITHPRKLSIQNQNQENLQQIGTKGNSPPSVNLPPLPNAFNRGEQSGQVDHSYSQISTTASVQTSKQNLFNQDKHRKSLITKTINHDQLQSLKMGKNQKDQLAYYDSNCNLPLTKDRFKQQKTSKTQNRVMYKQMSCDNLRNGNGSQSNNVPDNQLIKQGKVKKLQSLTNVCESIQNDPIINENEYMDEIREILKYKHLKFDYKTPQKSQVNNNLLVYGYGSNTSKGNTRDYNEDRIILVENASMPETCSAIQAWKKINLYAVLDGHGGEKCTNFVKDNFFNELLKDQSFIEGNFKVALTNTCHKIEQLFFSKILAEYEKKLDYDDDAKVDRSGVCVTVILFINRICYVAQLGDGRLILCKEQESLTVQVTRDHKPNDAIEKERILANGGQVYSRQMMENLLPYQDMNGEVQEPVNSIFRVNPGRLSVARTIGDIEAKLPQFGGKPNIIISTPDVSSFKVSDNFDFMVVGCDGIFDCLSNAQISALAWQYLKQTKSLRIKQNNNQHFILNIHQLCGELADLIIKAAAYYGSTDNLTVIGESYKQQLDLNLRLKL
eukprot:403374213